MQGKVCLVTGANRGIGRATAEGLARQGATVLMVCRDRERGRTRPGGDRRGHRQSPTRTFHRRLRGAGRGAALGRGDQGAGTSRLDVLDQQCRRVLRRAASMTADNIEATFAVNHLACFILINELADLLTRERTGAGRDRRIRSAPAGQPIPRTGSACKAYNGRTAYNRSKLANVIFSYDLAHRLEGSGVTVNCCHPGHGRHTGAARAVRPLVVALALADRAKRFTITPEEGAETVLYLATSPDVEGVTGKYFKSRTAGHVVADFARFGDRCATLESFPAPDRGVAAGDRSPARSSRISDKERQQARSKKVGRKTGPAPAFLPTFLPLTCCCSLSLFLQMRAHRHGLP